MLSELMINMCAIEFSCIYEPFFSIAAPVFLQRLVALLSSDVMSDSIVDRGLVSLKDEWMK